MKIPEADDNEHSMEAARGRIEERMSELLPSGDVRPDRLHRAMRHASLGGGKRLRGIMCLEAHRSAGDPYPDAALDCACAIEFLHAYTLVHDDMPLMDDDELRRGKPSCHVEFGEATALLAGDALQALAFEVISGCSGPPDGYVNEATRMLAAAAGSLFIVGGQQADMESEGMEPEPETVEFIHSRKTAELIAVSLGIGSAMAEGRSKRTARLVEAGRMVGLAFQITDDLLDVTGNESAAGKVLRKDGEKGKMTWPRCFGVEESRRKVEELTENAINVLRTAGEARTLEYIFKLIAGRNS